MSTIELMSLGNSLSIKCLVLLTIYIHYTKKQAAAFQVVKTYGKDITLVFA